MSATRLDATIRLVGREIFTAAEAPFAANELQRTLTVGGNTVSRQLGASTTPKVDKPPITLEIGATSTINLTAVTGLAMPPDATRTLDLTGAKLVGIVLRAADANAADVLVSYGASNPYPLFGTSKNIYVKPGEVLGRVCRVASGYPAVSASVKNIDVTITGSDVLYVDLYFGT